jgi:hypothetical protein
MSRKSNMKFLQLLMFVFISIVSARFHGLPFRIARHLVGPEITEFAHVIKFGAIMINQS